MRELVDPIQHIFARAVQYTFSLLVPTGIEKSESTMVGILFLLGVLCPLWEKGNYCAGRLAA